MCSIGLFVYNKKCNIIVIPNILRSKDITLPMHAT